MAENPNYKVIIDRTAFLEASLNESREQVNRLTEELGSLRKSRKEWEESIQVRHQPLSSVHPLKYFK